MKGWDEETERNAANSEGDKGVGGAEKACEVYRDEHIRDAPHQAPGFFFSSELSDNSFAISTACRVGERTKRHVRGENTGSLHATSLTHLET